MSLTCLLPRLLLSTLLPLLLTATTMAQKASRYTFEHRQMGTLFRIVLYAPDSIIATRAAEAAFRRVDTLNAILSDYLSSSELSRLSATAGTGIATRVSDDLWRVLQISQRAAARSKGAFDITVGPFSQLWRRSLRQQALPDDAIRTRAQQSVGYQYLRLDRRKRTVQLLKAGMRLDVGGIGKGYAVDQALAVLEAFGIRSALIDGGGNIVVSAAPPGRSGWEVEIRNHASSGPLLLAHAGISTSGDLYQYFDWNGQRYSHILDPRTGLGLTDQSQVTVIASDGTTADWLSTAVSVLGPNDGLRLVKKTKGAAARFTRRNGSGNQQWASRRWHWYSPGS